MDEGNNFGRNFENGAKCLFFLKKKKKTFLQLFVIILDCFRSLINACLFDKKQRRFNCSNKF